MDSNTLFTDTREKGENRLIQSKLVMLRMLKIFDYLCTKHEIRYFLVGGSLLGAIRHKGFIPWDDDIDVAMTRDNYEKFIRYAVQELPEDIFFQNRETDVYYPAHHPCEAKLRDKYSSYTRKGREKEIIKWQDGIMLDLCVFDRAFLPNNYLIYAENKVLELFGKKNSHKKRAKVLKFIAKYSPFPLVYASAFIQRTEAIYLGTEYFTEKEVSDQIRTPFEDTEVLIPIGWHGYLKRRWNNYMKLPPLEKQKGRHGANLPDPFTPCNHSEILYWKNRTKV